MNKPVVAMDIPSSRMGGPYVCTMNIANSKLKEDYDFHLFEYDINMGRFINWKRIMDVKHKIQAIHPDIIHFSGLQFSGFTVALAAKLAGVKHMVVVVHGSSSEAKNLSPLKRFIMRIFEGATLYLSDSFYGVSDHTINIPVCSAHKRKCLGVIYNFATKQYLEDSILKRSDFGFSDDDIVIISVARITIEKGFKVLGEVIHKTNDKRIKYLIVGDGDFLEEMKQTNAEDIASGKVVFTGKRMDVGSLLSLADVFVLPSLHENLPLSMLEAGSKGLPLIASKVGGVPEIIEEGVNGLLIKPDDTESLMDAITHIARNEEWRKRMGENSRKIMEAKFCEDVSLGKIRKMYDNMLKGLKMHRSFLTDNEGDNNNL